MHGATFFALPATIAGALPSPTALKLQPHLSHTLALVREHELHLFRGVSQSTILFCVIAGIAILALLAFVIQRRRRRWFQL